LLDDFVPDDVRLFRKVSRAFVVRDSKTGGRRLSSQAFQNNTNPKTERMSILLEDRLACDAIAPESIVAGTELLLVALRAGFVRLPAQGQSVERTPTAADPAHGDVVGPKPKSVQNSFARAAEWVVPSEGPDAL